MIKNFYITGDTHGKVLERLSAMLLKYPDLDKKGSALIILGDVGINYYGNKSDRKLKQKIEEFGLRIYCIRGNHEMRPQDIGTATKVWDEDVSGAVFMEEDFPSIRYFCDGGCYIINSHSTLVIGGAYSVDKEIRIKRAELTGNSHTGWFENEQLSVEEREKIKTAVEGAHYDLVLSHTCPRNWEPTDLFLPFVDQSTVDKSMEDWLEELKNSISWGCWLFGHYHADRIERPYVEQYYRDIVNLEDIAWRWVRYSTLGDTDFNRAVRVRFNF